MSQAISDPFAGRPVIKLFKSKPVSAPSELDLKLVDALEAVTECVEEHDVCRETARDSREVLEHAKAELGLRS